MDSTSTVVLPVATPPTRLRWFPLAQASLATGSNLSAIQARVIFVFVTAFDPKFATILVPVKKAICRMIEDSLLFTISHKTCKLFNFTHGRCEYSWNLKMIDEAGARWCSYGNSKLFVYCSAPKSGDTAKTYMITLLGKELQLTTLSAPLRSRSYPGLYVTDDCALLFGGVVDLRAEDAVCVLKSGEILRDTANTMWSLMSNYMTSARVNISPVRYGDTVYVGGNATTTLDRFSMSTLTFGEPVKLSHSVPLKMCCPSPAGFYSCTDFVIYHYEVAGDQLLEEFLHFNSKLPTPRMNPLLRNGAIVYYHGGEFTRMHFDGACVQLDCYKYL